jgi:antitoxin ParD1/3/4
MPTRNVSLTDHLDRFVDANIEAGRYQNASEVVREALRLLELQQKEQQARLERLREAIRLGEESLVRGDYVDVDIDDLGEFLEALDRTTPRLSDVEP